MRLARDRNADVGVANHLTFGVRLQGDTSANHKPQHQTGGAQVFNVAVGRASNVNTKQ